MEIRDFGVRFWLRKWWWLAQANPVIREVRNVPHFRLVPFMCVSYYAKGTEGPALWLYPNAKSSMVDGQWLAFGSKYVDMASVVG